MVRSTSKLVGWLGLLLWISGCGESRPPGLSTNDNSAALASDAGSETADAGGGSGNAGNSGGGAGNAGNAADDDAGNCVDAAAPTLEGRTVSLWPPNHKFHDIAVEDCVTV